MNSSRLWGAALVVFALGCGSKGPAVSAIEPSSGAFLSLVTLKGTGFTAEPDGNKVEFVTPEAGTYLAGIVSASETELTVLVPVPVAQKARV
ncbi:MAG: IPT/TIG domain-containing protein, partial [Myxococcaceae bacterium]